MISSALITNDLDLPPTYIVKLGAQTDATIQEFATRFVITCTEHNGNLSDAFIESLNIADNPLNLLPNNTIFGRIDASGLYLATKRQLNNDESWFCPHEPRLVNLLTEDIITTKFDWIFPTTFIYKFRKIDL